jgi:hypothetical protein
MARSPDRKVYGLRLDQKLMRAIKHLAVDEGRAVNDVTEEALRDLLKKYQERLKTK